jgi:hypothetical protein
LEFQTPLLVEMVFPDAAVPEITGTEVFCGGFATVTFSP